MGEFFESYKKELIFILSGAILLGSGISLGLGISELGKPLLPLQVSGLEHATSSDSATVKPPPSEPININKASAVELEILPGIGPSKAAAIVSYRRENGPFKTIAEIQNVSGIGPKTFEQLQSLITVK